MKKSKQSILYSKFYIVEIIRNKVKTKFAYKYWTQISQNFASSKLNEAPNVFKSMSTNWIANFKPN